MTQIHSDVYTQSLGLFYENTLNLMNNTGLNLQLNEQKSINRVSYREAMVSNHVHEDDASSLLPLGIKRSQLSFKEEYTKSMPPNLISLITTFKI